MSKKSLFCIGLLVLSLTLFSCGERQTSAVDTKNKLIIKSSYMNSPLFLAGTVLEGIINYNTNFLAVNESADSDGGDKIRALMDGSADVAFITGPDGYMAFNGHPSYWDSPQGIRSLFGIFPTVFSGFTADGKDIKRLSDLVGHAVAIDRKGSVEGDLLLYFLKLNGVNESNTKILRVDQEAGEKFFVSGIVDFLWYSGYNRDGMTKVLFTEDDKLREFLSVFPVFYTEVATQEDADDGGKQGRVFASSTFLACSEAMSDSTAYTIAKTWFENIRYTNNFFPNYSENNAKVYIERKVPVPMHPGAEKYFRDVGLLN